MGCDKGVAVDLLGGEAVLERRIEVDDGGRLPMGRGVLAVEEGWHFRG